MKLEIEVYDALCSLSIFKINDIDAEEEDFVNKYDHSPGTAEDYACGDMRADIKMPTNDILEKYKINLTEYNEIASKVADEVSFGCCGWCV